MWMRMASKTFLEDCRSEHMKNIGGTSKYIAFFDECGDHSLTKIDGDFPLFLLAAVIVEREVYTAKTIPMIGALKCEQFKKLTYPLVFRSKRDNIVGIQLADLCAHPCARHVLRPDQPNRAYDIVKKHLYKKGGVDGWKIFP